MQYYLGNVALCSSLQLHHLWSAFTNYTRDAQFERMEPTQVLENDQSSSQASSCDKTIIILTNTTNKSNYAV